MHALFVLRSYSRRSQRSFVERFLSTQDILTMKESFIECHGDYDEQAVLEDSELPLYAHQHELPRLPVPSLGETLDTFYPSAVPFSKHDDDSLAIACHAFLTQAATLQQRLLERRSSKTSWLQQWWNQIMYLKYREPLFYVSYFYRLRSHNNTNGLDRAAVVLQAATYYAQQVSTGQVPPDRAGPVLLCSTQYKYLFSGCRVPRQEQDVVRLYHHRRPKQQHVIVAHRGQFYKVYVTDASGRWYTCAALRDVLEQCTTLQPDLPELGWLPTTDRDTWADNYACMVDLGISFHEIESAICLVALDFDSTNEETESETARRLFHGAIRHSGNRWCDKSMQLVIDQVGRLGYIGEHSMADGMPSMSFCNFLLERVNGQEGELVHNISPGRAEEPSVVFEKAFARLSEADREEIEHRTQAAREEQIARIEEHHMEVCTFTDYGSVEMKKAGYSPDAFVQMALQLAGYRLFGECVGTYEATQTRYFRQGRTETTRSVSPASMAFVEIMGMEPDGLRDIEKKRLILQQATDAHTQYIRKAAQGLGVDRHFFGLSMMLQDGEKAPDLFSHPAFLASKRWRMSTSTVPGSRTGFAQVEPDGLGIGYDIQGDECVFTICGRHECHSVSRMHGLLLEALTEMKNLFPSQPHSRI